MPVSNEKAKYRIPEKLGVVLRGTVFYRDYKGKKHLVTPVRMVDIDDDIRMDWDSGELKEAADWARGLTGMKYRWMSEIYKGDPQGLIQAEYPCYKLNQNNEFSNPRILNMEKKENGETVWMAVLQDNWLVEVQEDVFLSLLFKQGVTANQRILGSFRWGVFDSKMMLLEHRSEKYNLLMKLAPPKPVPPGSPKVGGVYMKNETGRVFLGPVKHSGKTKYAWLWVGPELGPEYGGTSWQSRYWSRVQGWRHVHPWPETENVPVLCLVTEDAPHTEMIASIDLPDNYQTLITGWKDQEGYRLGDRDVTWL